MDFPLYRGSYIFVTCKACSNNVLTSSWFVSLNHPKHLALSLAQTVETNWVSWQKHYTMQMILQSGSRTVKKYKNFAPFSIHSNAFLIQPGTIYFQNHCNLELLTTTFLTQASWMPSGPAIPLDRVSSAVHDKWRIVWTSQVSSHSPVDPEVPQPETWWCWLNLPPLKTSPLVPEIAAIPLGYQPNFLLTKSA